MARARSEHNGNGRLDKLDEVMNSLVRAQTHLVEAQAAAQVQIARSSAEIAEVRRQQLEYERLAAERFSRIETILLEHSRILAEHSRILQALPEAVRAKIGFKPPQQG
jgi:hypothetical protein